MVPTAVAVAVVVAAVAVVDGVTAVDLQGRSLGTQYVLVDKSLGGCRGVSAFQTDNGHGA
jgi:hypothetical protein